MDTPAKVAIGGGLLSALTVGGLVGAGVLATSAGVVLADPTAPAAQAAGLSRFEDCDSLRTWYVDHAVDEVGPWGWGGRMRPLLRRETTMEIPGATAQDGLANGPTGTNTQEAGVDEPDVAKTDGTLVVRLEDGRDLVLTDVSGSRPRRLADWTLPGDARAEGLLLLDDHVLLAGTAGTLGREGGGPTLGSTELYDVDVSRPTSPHLAGHTTLSGRRLSLRQYGETVRVVTSLGLPPLPFVQPRPGGLSDDEAEQRNREVVRSSRIEDWVPGLACDQVFHPREWTGPDTVTVSTLHPGALGEVSRVAVTGAGSTVYSSADRLYVTATEWTGGPVALDDAVPDTSAASSPGPATSRPIVPGPIVPSPVRPSTRIRTHVHAFALGTDSTRYVASGSFSGSIRDRWSLDEHDGYLRVAVSWPAQAGQAGENGVLVLREQGGGLETVGRLAGLGTDEEVQAVRWFDDLAVVVTFRRTDPVHTVDLTDPTHPRLLGELKLPGFSSYLHPIDGDRLLGLGTDADGSGRTLGAQAAVLDIGDPTHVRRSGQVGFGPGTALLVSSDPHAFTWLPTARAAVVGLQRPGAVQTPSMVLLRVGPDGSLTTQDLPQVGGWAQRALPLPHGRVALVGTRVQLVDVAAAG